MLDLQLVSIASSMFVASLLAGLASGLFGVGGGIVLVPVLEIALGFAGVPADWRIHVAVATSSATIIPTALSSARAHHRRGSVDWALVKSWGLAIALGALGGSLLASRAASDWLTGLFGCAALVVALRMLLGDDSADRADRVPRGPGGSALAAAIGSVSAMMGVGAGTLGVPVMTALGFAVHRAVGTAAFLGVLVSVPATVGYLLARPDASLPWATVGLVSLIGVAFITPGAMLMTPVGARIAHGLSRRALARAFGLFLLCVAARMFYRTFAS